MANSRATIIRGLPELERRLAAIGTAGDAVFMADIAQEFVESAQRLAPEDTGALRRSIQIESVRPREAVVKAGGGDVDYARPVEYGSGLFGPRRSKFMIRARRAANLKFFWEREQVNFVGPKVNHPGSQAQPYFTPVVQTINLALRMKAEIVERWNQAA